MHIPEWEPKHSIILNKLVKRKKNKHLPSTAKRLNKGLQFEISSIFCFKRIYYIYINVSKMTSHSYPYQHHKALLSLAAPRRLPSRAAPCTPCALPGHNVAVPSVHTHLWFLPALTDIRTASFQHPFVQQKTAHKVRQVSVLAFNSAPELFRLATGTAILYAKRKFPQRFSNLASKNLVIPSHLETQNESILMSTIKICLPYGWSKTNTRWGSSCNSFFKKFSAVSLFQ